MKNIRKLCADVRKAQDAGESYAGEFEEMVDALLEAIESQDEEPDLSIRASLIDRVDALDKSFQYGLELRDYIKIKAEANKLCSECYLRMNDFSGRTECFYYVNKCRSIITLADGEISELKKNN